MSKIAFTETTGRTNYVDSDWTEDDIALFKTLDDSGVLLTYAQKMAIYNWGLAIKTSAAGGLRAVAVSINSGNAGVTYTINGATTSILVIRNNVTLQSDYTFDPSTGVWTFTDPLTAGEKLTFLYS